MVRMGSDVGDVGDPWAGCAAPLAILRVDGILSKFLITHACATRYRQWPTEKGCGFGEDHTQRTNEWREHD